MSSCTGSTETSPRSISGILARNNRWSSSASSRVDSRLGLCTGRSGIWKLDSASATTRAALEQFERERLSTTTTQTCAQEEDRPPRLSGTSSGRSSSSSSGGGGASWSSSPSRSSSDSLSLDSGKSEPTAPPTDRSEAIKSAVNIQLDNNRNCNNNPPAPRVVLPPLRRWPPPVGKTISQIRRRSSPPPVKPPPSPTAWSSLVPPHGHTATVTPDPSSTNLYPDFGSGSSVSTPESPAPPAACASAAATFDANRAAAVGAIFRQFASMLLTNNKVDVLDGTTGTVVDDSDSGVVVGGTVGPDGSLAGGGGGRHSGGTTRKVYSGTHTTRLENTHLDTTASGHSMLDSNRVRMMSPYLAYSTVMSHAIQEFFEGKVRGKLDTEHIFYDNMLLYFSYFFCFRNLLLAFIEEVEWRGWLGETERARPQRQLVMVFTIWSVYIALSIKNFNRAMNTKYKLSWLQPFQVLRGESTPQTYGLSLEMLHDWYDWTMSMWRRYFLFSMSSIVTITLFFIGLVRHRWNSYPDESMRTWFNVSQVIWAVINVAWAYLCATHTYVCFVYFNSLCYYFRLRYMKVNRDIETIINQRLKANERVAMLQHVLVEHNELCLKVAEYNKFWAKYLMATYFFLIAVICFTMFQAFFTTNPILVRLVMFTFSCTCAFIITRISISAAVMSNMAHAPYGRLIRVSFEKYPVELQIQLRMFIQRTSGPTIGFYCLDVFEITYTTYASILAALGQNFLLIVDFVRSYAEVGKEYEEISMSQFNLLTESVFNSTLDVIDEMTGAHLAESYTNHTLLELSG